VFGEEREDVFALELRNRGFVADDRPAVGMGVEDRLKQALSGLPFWIVDALL